MRAVFLAALFAAVAVAAPNPNPEPEMGFMPRACPGIGAHCSDGQHWVSFLPHFLVSYHLHDMASEVSDSG
jgi:hypothetical protein